MPINSDVQKAKDWLKAWPKRWFAVEEVQREANLSIGTPALAGKFRLARKRGELESRVREGKTYMEYHYNTDYKPQERPVKATGLFFYTLRNTMVPSPYFESLEAIIDDVHHKFGDMRVMPDYRVWQGSHERPYPVEEK